MATAFQDPAVLPVERLAGKGERRLGQHAKALRRDVALPAEAEINRPASLARVDDEHPDLLRVLPLCLDRRVFRRAIEVEGRGKGREFEDAGERQRHDIACEAATGPRWVTLPPAFCSVARKRGTSAACFSASLTLKLR
jgi:hypothetical protein